ncbi:MAG TPA: hypothetical protein VJ651_22935 [Noviherbaspirillum sp.]|nr:hypothetical protein [Noviherbaspirillum sp.]
MLLHVFDNRFPAGCRHPSRAAPASALAGHSDQAGSVPSSPHLMPGKESGAFGDEVSFRGKRELKCRIERRRLLRLIITCRHSISMLEETSAAMRFHLAARRTGWRYAGVAFTSGCKNDGNEMLSVQALTSSKQRRIARHSSCVGKSQCIERMQSNRIGGCTISADFAAMHSAIACGLVYVRVRQQAPFNAQTLHPT